MGLSIISFNGLAALTITKKKGKKNAKSNIIAKISREILDILLNKKWFLDFKFG